jgi:hypothetical protein
MLKARMAFAMDFSRDELAAAVVIRNNKKWWSKCEMLF